MILRKMTVLVVCAGFCISAVTTSCANSSAPAAIHQTPAVQALDGTPAVDLSTLLPAPASLLEQQRANRQASFAESDVSKDGSTYIPWGNNRVTAGLYKATFSPQWQDGDPISDAAYCVYYFQPTDYDRAPVVYLDFQVLAPDASITWIALANWNRNTWEWQGAGERTGTQLRFDAGDFAPHFSSSWGFYLVVLVTNSGSYDLRSLRLGPTPPNASLVATPTYGHVPLDVSFDASGSVATENPIAKFEWDFDGDGAYEEDTGLTGTATHTYASGGTVHPAVRVTDTVGTRRSASIDIYPVDEWQHTWGDTYHDNIVGAVADNQGYLYTLGSITDTPSGNNKLLLAKWTPTGELIYARKHDSGASEFPTQLVINDLGYLWAVGTTTALNGTSDVFFIYWWGFDNNICNAYGAGGTGLERDCEMFLDGATCYLAGTTDSLTLGSDVFLLKVDDAGLIQWQVACDKADADTLTDLAPMRNSFGTATGLAAVFDYADGAVSHLCKLEYDLNGAMTSSSQLGSSLDDVWDAHLACRYNPLTLSQDYYIGGMTTITDTDYVFLSKTDGSGASVYCTLLPPAGTADLTAMALDSAGYLYLCGLGTVETASLDGLLYVFQPDTGAALASCYWHNTALEDSRFDGVLPYLGGCLMVGSTKDATPSWNESVPSPDTASYAFSDTTVSEPAVSWTFTEIPMAMSDITEEGEFDLGAGEDDNLLVYRSGFGT